MYKLGRGEVIVEKLKRLTEMTTSGGWAAKIGPEVLASVLSQLPKNENNNNLLVGLDTADDAAVYKLNDETALIQTLDFFTPMIDDPYIFGQIAAANSLSDVYAMGGKPIVAMNIVCFPSCHDMNILAENAASRSIKLSQVCSGFIKDNDGNIKKLKSNKIETLKNFLDNYDKKLVIFAEFKQSIKDIKTLILDFCKCINSFFSV